MLSCWNIDPLERPSFETVRNTMENILHKSEDYLALEGENEEWKDDKDDREWYDGC